MKIFNKMVSFTMFGIVSGCLLDGQLVKAEPVIISQQNVTNFTENPPTLVKAVVPHNTIYWRLAWYYFTVNLPANSQESLGKITITPNRNFEEIDFNLEETQAFQGQQNRPGEPIEIKEVNLNETTQAIEIIFAEPIAPDTLFTVALKAKQNPGYAGVYLFRIHAFPWGENPVGLDLGVARLSFYSVW